MTGHGGEVRIDHAGFDPLVTHIFVDGDEYLDSDCVFGVRSSCIGKYRQHEAGVAPDGSKQPKAFFTNDSTFVLERESRVSDPAARAPA